MGFPGGASGKEFTCKQETWVQSLGQEDLLQEEMATHSSILAGRIPWTEEPGGLQPIGLQRAEHDWSNIARTQADMLLQPLWERDGRWGRAASRWGPWSMTEKEENIEKISKEYFNEFTIWHRSGFHATLFSREDHTNTVQRIRPGSSHQ